MRNLQSIFSVATLAATTLALGAGARAQDAPKPDDATPTPPGVTVNGTVETYYTYNFNRPTSGSNTFLFNSRDAQFALNLADLRIGKAATPASRTGFLVRFIAGDVEPATIAGDDFDNILEAYGTLLVPLGGRDVKIDVGQFVTHVGYETIDLGTNPNFSKSFLFQFPPPFYNGGVRAAFPLSDKTTVTGFLLNRFNGLNDPNNKDIAPGFQITHALSPTSSLILNGLSSREFLGFGTPPVEETAAMRPRTAAATRQSETGGEINRQQSILDLIYTSQITPSTKIAAEALYRWGKDVDDNSYGVYGLAGYASFTLASGNVLSLRGEYYKQGDVVAGGLLPAYPTAPGRKVELSELTLTYELRSGLFPGLRTLFELRHDRASEPFFGDRGGGFRKDQNTLTVAQSFSF